MSPFSHLHEVQSSGHLELEQDFLDIGEIGLSTGKMQKQDEQSPCEKWDRKAVKIFLYFPFSKTTRTTKENNDEQQKKISEKEMQRKVIDFGERKNSVFCFGKNS